MIKLAPCPSCARHVHEGAPTCPFCARDRGDHRRATPVALAIVAAGVLMTTPAAAQAAPDGGMTDAAADATMDALDAAADAAALADESRQEWNRPIPLYGLPPPPHSCGCETTHAPTSNAAVLAAAAVGALLLARRRRDP